MKILLISDTHGNVDIINQLAGKHHAEYCFHTGDICCFDHRTIPFFSDAELRQMIKHSQAARFINEKTSRKQMEEIAAEYYVYGQFYQYANGEKGFDIPVFAVMGNREDLRIINEIQQKKIHHFSFLDNERIVYIENLAFMGIGGTFAESSLLEEMKSPGVIYPVISRSQLKRLAEASDGISSKYKRVFLTHMGPAEAPKMKLIAQRLGANYVFSGHTHHFSAQDWYCEQAAASSILEERYNWDPSKTTLRNDRFLTLSYNLPKASSGYMILNLSSAGTDISFCFHNIGS